MSFARYPEYRHSGVDWLGPVPAHWEVVPLKRAAGLVTERATETQNPVALENIEGWTGRLVPSETEFQAEGIAFLSGDVLYGKLRPYLAKTLVAEAHGEAVGDFHVLRPGVGVVPTFVGYLLRTRETVSILDGSTHGSKMPRVAWEVLATLPFPKPPPAEQAAIAAFLDRETAKIDGLIGEQRRLVALLKEKRQSVIAHAVTKGLNPAAPLKPSGIDWLGDIPAHWGVMPLRRLVSSVEQGWSPQCENVPVEGPSEVGVIKAGSVNGNEFNPSENKKLPDGVSYDDFLRLRAGDVLVSRANTKELVGSAVALDRDYENLLLCDKVYRFRMDRRLSPRFVALFLGTKMARSRIEAGATGASASMQNISQDVLLNIDFPLPPPQEQAGIEAGVELATSQLDLATSEALLSITLLQERRAALISAAVAGKIDVRDVWTPAATLRPALSVIDGGRAQEPAAPTRRLARTSRVRLLVAARVAERLAGKDTFGRTQMQKYLYLAENHLGISDLDGRFERQAAGPLDRSQLHEVERALLDARIARTDQEETGRRRVHYTLLPHRPDLRGELIATIGADKAAALDALIGAMETFQTPSVEAVATLYAAWNDALIDGRALDDDALIAEVETNWHEDKSIPRATLVEMLGWMKRNGIVPTGTGRKTIPTMQGGLF